MELREIQRPLKQGYRDDPSSAHITLTARGSQTDAPVSCSVDIGRAIYEAQAHAGAPPCNHSAAATAARHPAVTRCAIRCT